VPLGWQFLIAAGLAGSVGLAEILTRYRSDPLKALGRLGAWLYIALNAGAGAGASTAVSIETARRTSRRGF
jgi:hypothetical protein